MSTWSEEITDWQLATFGSIEHEFALERATEEWEELVAIPGSEGATDLDAALEAADVVICLAAFVRSLGFDLAALVSGKLDVNRLRKWRRDADGMWRHVKEGS